MRDGALEKLCAEQPAWAARNFGEAARWEDPFMGLVEEVGELAHALLKQRQGIRGTPEQLEEEAQDAVGDIVIYLADLCHRRRWDLPAIVRATWSRVSRRDWKAHPEDGGDPDPQVAL